LAREALRLILRLAGQAPSRLRPLSSNVRPHHRRQFSMSNYHWVCFSCHESVRRHGSADDVRCPRCAKPCQNIGYKIPVPPKSKPQLWQELAQSYAEARRRYFHRQNADSVRRAHDLEHEIARIGSLEPNEGRLSLLKRLREELATLRAKHEELLASKNYYLQGQLPPKPSVKRAP
jgi:hypothetical protein